MLNPSSRQFALLVVSLVLISAGCSSNPYRPFDGSIGYSESPIRPDEFEVSYAADSDVAPTQARYYATVRAAQLALNLGKPFFEITSAREQSRVDTVTVPGSTNVITNEAGSRSSRTRWTTINQSPDYTRSYIAPLSTLTIHVFDTPTPKSLDATQILKSATQKGIELLDVRPAQRT